MIEQQGSGESRRHRVFVVDDHDVVRLGVTQVINKHDDLIVCGEAVSVSTALPLVRQLKPDILVTDISLKDSNGLELVKVARAEFPRMFMLVMSMHDEGLWAESAVRAGANGFIDKENSIQTLIPAIRSILRGNLYVSEVVLTRLMRLKVTESAESALDLLGKLSDRERQVLLLTARWKSSREIASELNLSVKTVDYYKQLIKQKLGLKSAAELQQFALQHAR